MTKKITSQQIQRVYGMGAVLGIFASENKQDNLHLLIEAIYSLTEAEYKEEPPGRFTYQRRGDLVEMLKRYVYNAENKYIAKGSGYGEAKY